MMFIAIEDNYLKMNRGDSYILPLVINEGTKLDFKQYQLRQFDKIYVGIMEYNQAFEDAIIRKVITITSPTDRYGHPLLKLSPKDTEYLVTGKYFIEIKLVQNDFNEGETVTTILPLKEFFINGTTKNVLNTCVNAEPVEKVTKESNWEHISEPTQSNPVMIKSEYQWVQI